MRLAKGLILTLATLAGLAVACELVLRFALGLGNPVLIQADAACSFIVKPDQDLYRFFSHTRINHEGMRSDEVKAVRDPRALRIMFVGDSVTYGTTRVDQRNLFTEIVHRKLARALNRPVEVLNASASAWAPDNEVAYVRSRGAFGSDMVVLVLNDGDPAQPRATIEDVGDDLPRQRPLTAIGELYSRYLRPRLFHAPPKVDAGDSVAIDAQTLNRNLADLDSLYDLLKSQGTGLMIVFIPFRRDIPQVSEPALASLKAWSASHHTPLMDLTSTVAAYSPGQISLDGGTHLNVRGHQAIGDAIVKQWPALALSADGAP